MRLIDADKLDWWYKGRQIRRVIDDAPTVDAAPVVHGCWLENDDGWGGVYYTCSACGEDWVTIDGTPMENNMHYCPKCGAKMDLEGGGSADNHY